MIGIIGGFKIKSQTGDTFIVVDVTYIFRADVGRIQSQMYTHQMT